MRDWLRARLLVAERAVIEGIGLGLGFALMVKLLVWLL